MYLGIAVLATAALLGVAGLYAVGRVSAVSARPLISQPYLGGWVPEQHALCRYHARYYPVTLLFLAFDVEMLFMYPWAAVVSRLGAGAVVEMFVFLGVLGAGVLWAWREGAFRWA